VNFIYGDLKLIKIKETLSNDMKNIKIRQKIIENKYYI